MDEDKNPEDELRELMRRLLSGDGEVDPSQLAGVAGLPSDPAALQALMAQLQSALMNPNQGGLNLETAQRQALDHVSAGTKAPTAEERTALESALHVASLWLAEATDISELTEAPAILSRTDWIVDTMPLWVKLSEPVATSIGESLTSAVQEQAPEEMAAMLANASTMIKNLGGMMFALQLGHVVGKLSEEVVSGGDIGIPILSRSQAALLPQNIAEFSDGLDIDDHEIAIYLSVRELAHARLFRHAKWLRLHLITAITNYAHGISIDMSRIEELAQDFDPANPEDLNTALNDGSLIPPRSEEQDAALARLETTLALIEGWVDVVTRQATTRLPKSSALSETVRRRRASGGPAEAAFGTLVGLELRPRRLREAAAMWQRVTDELGAEQRDALWSHPDVVPSEADIDSPDALIARLRGDDASDSGDEFDRAIEDLLRDDTPRPHENSEGGIDEGDEGPKPV